MVIILTNINRLFIDHVNRLLFWMTPDEIQQGVLTKMLILVLLFHPDENRDIWEP